MTFEQIIELSKAGFSAEQIAAIAPLINGGNNQPVNPPAQPVVNEPAQTVVNEPIANPAIPAEPANTNSNIGFADVMKELSKLTSAITANAIMNNRQPVASNTSAEDALASIVIPTK